MLRQATGANPIQLLNQWTGRSSLELDMGCQGVYCDTKQKEVLYKLLQVLGLHDFWVDAWIEQDLVDSEVWLGVNKTFCPDPLEWEPRQLHHGAQPHVAEREPQEAGDQDDFLVWGEGVVELEPDQNNDPAEQLDEDEETHSNEHNARTMVEVESNRPKSHLSRSRCFE
jgi:hypothetical protein